MRKLNDPQGVFDFQGPRLAITVKYYERYMKIERLLEGAPSILEFVHKDLCKALDEVDLSRECPISSDSVLRTIIVQLIEGLSLREVVVRIDDSTFLRRFVKIHDASMMSYSTLCRLKNQIEPATWTKVNQALAMQAFADDLINGADLRVDTTAYETNVHYPADSSLLFDVYRVVAKLVRSARRLDRSIAEDRRLQVGVAKKHYTRISRKAGKKTETLHNHYKALLGLVSGVLTIGSEVSEALAQGLKSYKFSGCNQVQATQLVEKLDHYQRLGAKVMDQTTRRVMHGETVPNSEKIFSIHEPHTELLKRGKAGKPIEFGHMVLLQQTREKFISGYEVFEKKPVEHSLVSDILAKHRKLFGDSPSVLTGDKGFYESMEKIDELETEIELVAIGKKGSRTAEEVTREHSFAFKMAQAFRAGIEGSISFLKRALRMSRCLNKGWKNYSATVGATIFAHNLLVLVRDPL